VSNRQLFSRLQPDPRTLDKLNMYELGNEKRGRFERKKWFRYNEPPVKLPHIDFFAGAQAAESFPKESVPEIGFVGRSNVGKSTLINKICGSTAARVSDKPGLTQQINFYTANNEFHLVDMPGFGFAYAKEDTKNTWRVMLLLDARHGIKANDREFMGLLDRTNTKYQIVLTKCDLIHRIDLAKRHLLVSQETAKSRNCIQRVMMVSARHENGLNELRKEIL
ncbi:P-loop containing nucleoside triphosphate hydrolase protein, partial [Martensiomyces pterosporus]